MEWSSVFIMKNFDSTSFSETLTLMALVRPVLHRLSCNNETVRNTPKHEFWVQWSGSGAFVAKSSDTTSFSELGR
jgi:hypothetical protein